MEVGDSGSRGPTEVAIKAARQQPRRLRETVARGSILAGEITQNVSMVTLRKRRAIETNLGQNQPVMPMAASLSEAPGDAANIHPRRL
jgi:hypothetical protein